MPCYHTIRDLVDRMADARCTKPFLLSPERGIQWTYADLQQQTRRLARQFRRMGFVKGDKVAFLMDNGLFTAGLLLGSMYGGFVPVPLNVRAGRAHLAYTLDHCDTRVVFVSGAHRAALEDARVDIARELHVIDADVDQGPDWGDADSEGGLLPAVEPDDPVLLMYTSGSTGQPKGAVHTQRQFIAAASNSVLAHKLTEQDCSLCVLPLYHINAINVTLLPTLATGGTVVMPRRFLVKEFWEWISRYRCTWSALVPTIIAQLVDWIDPRAAGMDEALGRIRFLRSSSAPLAPSLHRAFEDKFRLPLIEAMGSTECGGNIFSNPPPPGLDKVGTPGLPYGFEARLVGPDGADVPVGEPGEILLSGPGVMTGYYKNPDGTAAVLADGWLRTGDLAQCDKDGYFFIVGRAKELIIKGGMNVAPRQIDDALSSHPAVLEAAALGVPSTVFGEDIVAFAVLRQGCQANEQDLLDCCERQLGLFKTPSRIFIVNDLPKGPSGKVQRMRLAECFPDILASVVQSAAVPLASNGAVHPPAWTGLPSAVEELVTQTWAEVLHEQVTSVDANFFGLGGHSLLAIETLSRLRKRFGVELSVNEFFTSPTVAQQARLLSERLFADGACPPADRAALEAFLAQRRDDGGAAAIPCGDRSQSAPLSHAQERLWFLERLCPGLRAFNEADAVRLHGELDCQRLQRALNAIITRHEALRTVFQATDTGIVQVVREIWTIDIRRIDLSARSAQERTQELDRLLIEEPARPFDLTAEPAIRAALVRLDAEDHVLIITLHHAVCDGWSFGVLCRELEYHYRELAQSDGRALAPPAIQYRDFAAWQRGQVAAGTFDKELAFWKEYLHGAPPALELPTKCPRPDAFTYRGEKRAFSLGRAATEQLRRFSRQEQVSLFTVLTTAYNVLLGRYTGQEDIVLGIPLANRDRPELLSLFGFLIDFQALRTDLSGDPTFRELLGRVRKGMLDVNAHRSIPFNKVVEAIQPQRDPARAPVFQTMLVWKDRHVQFLSLELPGLSASHVMAHPGASKYDLTLFLTDMGDELWVEAEYCTDLFTAEMIRRLVEHFRVLLTGVMTDPEAKVSRLPLLTEAERQELLVEWNRTHNDYPHDTLLHELFEAQAARTPHQIAVIHEGRSCTYAALNERADALARRLRGMGVGPDVLVALYADRSLEAVVGLLGILKAGGAYLPLDPLYPAHRLAFMLQDARPLVVLVQPSLRCALPPHSGHVIALDESAPSVNGTIAVGNGESVQPRQTPASLAYVLYTSGSAGEPKGVQVSHGAVVNLLTAMRREPGFHAHDVLLSVTTLAFDIAGLEVFLPLTTGAQVVIASRDVVGDGHRLARLLDETGATVMQATPATWRMLLHAGWRGSPQLKVLCGGEALPSDLADSLLPRCAELWNLFGPTETTIWSTVARVKRGEPITIGKPIANTQAYVLDRAMQPVPIGVAGELFLGGAGLARGYLNRQELTEARFVTHPFADQAGARLYRTGDQVRYRSDGSIEYLGRVDQQVKIRGFRIELGEIEAILGRHPHLREAAVAAREDGVGGKRLVGYVVPRNGTVPAGSDLRAFLERHLPPYMVPATFMALKALPLTANGKVNRAALPAPLGTNTAADWVAPRTPAEQKLATIWGKVLGVSRVGVHDDFFALGGHSLLGVYLFAEIEKAFGQRPPLALLFQGATVERLARLLEQPPEHPARTELVAIQPLGNKEPLLFLPSLVGEIAYAHRIAQRIGTDRPVFGVHPCNAIAERAAGTTLEEIASRYADDLCALQPAGAFRLAGYSFAGFLAYETARQLTERGRQVDLLAVIDTGPSRNASKTLAATVATAFAVMRNLPAWLIANVVCTQPRGFFATLAQHLRSVVKRAGRIVASGGRTSLTPEVGDLFDVAQLPPDYRAMIEANLRALREYRPKPYQGRLTLIRARARPLLHSLRADLGWSEWARGGVDIRCVPGHHASILDEPNVGILADHLRAAADQTA